MRVNSQNFLRRSGQDTPDHPSILTGIMAALPPLSPTGPWVAGGLLRRVVAETSLDGTDIDVFFANEEQRIRFEEALVGKGAQIKRVGETLSVFTMYVPATGDTTEIQCIYLRYYSSPEDVIDTFDFTICQIAHDGTDFVFGDFTLWDLARKRLVLHKLTYPVATIRRVLKYTKQGFYICAGAIQEILQTVASNPALLENSTEYVD